MSAATTTRAARPAARVTRGRSAAVYPPAGHDPTTLAAAIRRRAADLETARALAAADARRRDVRAQVAIAASLARLEALGDRSTIIDATPAEVCRACGFSRAMVSRVTGSTWIPEATYAAPAAPGRRSFATYIDSSRTTPAHSQLESEIVRRRTAILVTDAQADPRTLKPMMIAGGVTSYAVAPIVIQHRVIGLLQVDRRGQGREVDDDDRLTLGIFSSHFSLLLECVTLRARLAQQRAELHAALLRVAHATTSAADEELSFDRGATIAAPPRSTTAATAPDGVWAALTPRQQDVLRLMITGLINRQIAEQLGIAEGTVKSHVKAILRTLRVRTRSQAVARCTARQHHHRS